MNREEILFRTFPRRAECTMKWQGSAGGDDVTNYYCILGANSLAQYIFLFLWFWYTLLLAIHVLNLIRITLMIQRIGGVRNIFLMSAVGSTKVIRQNFRTNLLGLSFLTHQIKMLKNNDNLLYFSSTKIWKMKEVGFQSKSSV